MVNTVCLETIVMNWSEKSSQQCWKTFNCADLFSLFSPTRSPFFYPLPVLIFAVMAVLEQEDEQDDSTDHGDQAQKDGPAAAPGVVQAADGDGKSGNNDAKGIEGAQDAHGSHGNFKEDDAQDDQGVDQDKIPILAAPGTAAELGILLKGLDIPVHRLVGFRIGHCFSRFGSGYICSIFSRGVLQNCQN